MSPKQPARRFRWGRLLVVGAIVAAAVLAFLYLQCGSGWGFGPGSGKGEGKGSARPAVSTPLDAAVPRCQLRVDAAGVALEGKPVEIAAAVAACDKAGAADVVVTGDARQGQWDQLKAALDGAGVKSFVRGRQP